MNYYDWERQHQFNNGLPLVKAQSFTIRCYVIANTDAATHILITPSGF